MRKALVVAVPAVLTAVFGLAWGAALPTPAAPASVAHATALRLMPLGDSITWGVGSSTGNGYRAVLRDELSSQGHRVDFVGSVRHGDMADSDNEGHPGYRIDQIAALTDTALARYRPNVVTLEIGTNDLNQDHRVATAADRLSALIDRITADDPGVTVLVGSLIPSRSHTEEPHRPAFNRAVPGVVRAKRAAGEHVGYVDMSAVARSDLASPLHPDDRGYRKMAAAFDRAVQSADRAGWIKAPAAAGTRSGFADRCLNAGTGENGTVDPLWRCDSTEAPRQP